MLEKNLKYYRLKKNMTKKDLAASVGVTPMAITNYENGTRRPSMDLIQKLAEVLGVRVSDFLANQSNDLEFVHGQFRKNSNLSKLQQEYIKASVEEYLNRFYAVVEILGGEVLPETPKIHQIPLSAEVEENARAMRQYLDIAPYGPVGSLVDLLENKGILVYFCDIDSKAFSGMNGTVNHRPYIIINQAMSPERIRSTIAHEMAHFIFQWPESMGEKEMEELATAISGAFLFPERDARRELGIRRTAITHDMTITCAEYGISMYLLVKRAGICGIISNSVSKSFYIRANQSGWKQSEPIRIDRETPMLFEQLVLRAVSEHEISVQRGAELLQTPRAYVEEQCSVAEG